MYLEGLTRGQGWLRLEASEGLCPRRASSGEVPALPGLQPPPIVTWPSSLCLSLSPSLLFFLLYVTSHSTPGPLVQDDHTARPLMQLHLQRPSFQNGSRSRAPGVRTWADLLGDTVHPTSMSPKLRPGSRLLALIFARPHVRAGRPGVHSHLLN